MPILDSAASQEELEGIGEQYAVDSLYAGGAEDLQGLTQKAGWDWGGNLPEWGPFGSEAGFRMGLLPLDSLLSPGAGFVQPTWDPHDPADLCMSALFGLVEAARDSADPHLLNEKGRPVPLGSIASSDRSTLPIGAIKAAGIHLRSQDMYDLKGEVGIYIIRTDSPADVVDFWNRRIYGTKLIGVPSSCEESVLRYLLKDHLPQTEVWRGLSETPEPAVAVWGLEAASPQTLRIIEEAAERDGLSITPRERRSWPNYYFQGVVSTIARDFRIDFRSNASWVDIPIPKISLAEMPEILGGGIVAADVQIHQVIGQDPRLTASIPPYRQHSAIFRMTGGHSIPSRSRIIEGGQAIGVDVTSDHARFAFGYNLDVFNLLLDEKNAHVSQSDVGKFQSRAAERLNGPFSGVFNQPGVRAAVATTAGRREGLAMNHLRRLIEDKRGEWPDLLSNGTPSDYAINALNQLLHAGLFVPTLRTHCSHCRVEHWESADNLGSVMRCEFCGESFNLALSHSLTKPDWRYRLAAHLRDDQVQALMPALAVSSLLRQLRLREEPPLAHVLGLEISLRGAKSEADLAMYIPEPDHLVIMGEVKGSNRIDSEDVEKISRIIDHLREKRIRTLALFATLKENFSSIEVETLRRCVETSKPMRTTRGQIMPGMPIVLVGSDLSHPHMSKDHPWRWDNKNFSGLLGTAVTSCERNLGLKSYRMNRDGSITCEWSK